MKSDFFNYELGIGIGTPGGSRTHNETDFKSATSSNWATGASFGTLGGN